MLLKLAFAAAAMILIVPAKWLPPAMSQQPALTHVLEWRAPLQHNLLALRADMTEPPGRNR